jgi:hypothetical protein
MAGKFEWMKCNGVPVSENERDAWAENLLREIGLRPRETAFMRSGDAIVVVVSDSDGYVTVYDAVVRRTGWRK